MINIEFYEKRCLDQQHRSEMRGAGAETAGFGIVNDDSVIFSPHTSAHNIDNLMPDDTLRSKGVRNSVFSQSPMSGNVQPDSLMRSAAFMERRQTSQQRKAAEGEEQRLVKKLEYLPVPGTSHGTRQRRSTILNNPNNDRNIRLSCDFSMAPRGAV